MNRTLQPELLDELPPADPRAVHSRRDLRRINALMGNARTLRRFVDALPLGGKVTLAEIGAGDGNIAFQLAKHLERRGIQARLLLVDRAPVVTEVFSHEVIQSDVFDWLETKPKADIIVANLFLHHFEIEALKTLFAGIAEAAPVFAATEPRRARFAPWLARQVWTIGCNDVTCHDAEISVKAGFNDRELSKLWPASAGWTLAEKRAGLFSHFFSAVRAR